uniref:Uncharacterized protein n=1 Tax=Zea mays TaxID=4577 RepID=C4J8Q3_MAIZE|nr:unknown [Zea mays]
MKRTMGFCSLRTVFLLIQGRIVQNTWHTTTLRICKNTNS